MRLNRAIHVGMLIGLLGVLYGCAPTHMNEPLQTHNPQVGYRMSNLKLHDENTNSTFVVVTFSGGGTRAAALAYGVLQGLRDIELPQNSSGTPRSLLDEVDVISSVSGGSFTALAYGLWGDDIFNGHFEQSFLRHNIERNLILSGLNPINVLAGTNTSELAARYYDEHVFRGATYQDLITRGYRPYINVNAADMARQEQFQFTQHDFDLLGSDLSQLPLAWAAASSSAVPVLLDPLRFKYHHGQAMAAAVREALASAATRGHPAHRRWARDLVDPDVLDHSGGIKLDEKDHKYLYLLDGGIVDNLGITPFFLSLRRGVISRLLKAGEIDRIVVVVVDAGTDPPNHIESSASTPGGLISGFTAATSGIHTGTWIQKAMLRYLLLEAFPETRRAYELCASGEVEDMPALFNTDYYDVDVHFSSLQDESERRRFLSLPTSFVLDDDDVDALIAVGIKLVKENLELQRLLQDLHAGASGRPK